MSHRFDLNNPPQTPVPAVHHKDYVDLLIYPNGQSYPISFNRMDSAAKVLGWIRHLTSKRNVTTKHIAALIASAERIGVSVVSG